MSACKVKFLGLFQNKSQLRNYDAWACSVNSLKCLRTIVICAILRVSTLFEVCRDDWNRDPSERFYGVSILGKVPQHSKKQYPYKRFWRVSMLCEVPPIHRDFLLKLLGCILQLRQIMNNLFFTHTHLDSTIFTSTCSRTQHMTEFIQCMWFCS